MFAPPTASTTARGYGAKHQQLRKHWAVMVATGTVRCWRCGHLLLPGVAWDLGHDDHDRTTYRGPEHRHPTPWCKGNRKAGLIKAANNNKRKAKAKTVSGTLAVASVAVARATDGPRALTRSARSGVPARPSTAARW